MHHMVGHMVGHCLNLDPDMNMQNPSMVSMLYNNNEIFQISMVEGRACTGLHLAEKS